MSVQNATNGNSGGSADRNGDSRCPSRWCTPSVGRPSAAASESDTAFSCGRGCCIPCKPAALRERHAFQSREDERLRAVAGDIGVDAAKTGAWDIAFLGSDPARETVISFTAAYLEIEATYLVPADSAIRGIEDIDRETTRIGVADASPYDLFLRRSLKRAQLVLAALGVELMIGDR